MAADHSEDVCVLVPTYNEAATIGEVIDGFHDQGLENVLVIDGHSSDRTREIARDRGARVVEQSGEGEGAGKGQAVREAIGLIDAPYVLMVDGDGTYRPEDASAMLEPLLSGEAEHVIGDRFAHMEPEAMPRLNQFGNRAINRVFRVVHGQNYGDILSGYRAFTRESAERLSLTAEGFTIETEFAVECVKHAVAVEVVPITYRPRPDDSDTNLDPFRDGTRIVVTLYLLAKTNNPLFYFGSIGLLSLLGGSVIGTYVGIEWFVHGIAHEVLAVASALGLLLGVQLLIFGVLSDMIATLHREQLRRMRQVERRTVGDGRPTPGADGDPVEPDHDSTADPRVGSEDHGEERPAEDDTTDRKQVEREQARTGRDE